MNELGEINDYSEKFTMTITKKEYDRLASEYHRKGYEKGLSRLLGEIEEYLKSNLKGNDYLKHLRDNKILYTIPFVRYLMKVDKDFIP